MDATTKFWIAVIVAAAILLMSLILLLTGIMGVGVFIVAIVIGFALIFLATFVIRDREIDANNESIRLMAPFVKTEIPIDKIDSIHTFNSIRLSNKIFGYSGISVKYGDFVHRALGNVICACDERVSKFIMVVSGKKKYIFNMKSVEETDALLKKIADNCDKEVSEEEYVLTPEEIRSVKRTKRITIMASSTAVVVGVILVSIFMFMGSVSVTLTDTSVVVKASMMNDTIDYDDITSVELRTDMDYGSRLMGLSNNKVLTGTFDNKEFGHYHLAVYRSTSEAIVIHTGDHAHVVNLSDSASTIKLYNDLLAKL